MSDTTTMTRSAMTVTNFEPMSAGTMRGVCNVTSPSGMVLHRRGIFAEDGKARASPPSKQVIGRDGTVQQTADGKVRYEQTGSFIDRATGDRWSDQVIEALLIGEPEALA
jgi:hypothetical protein